MARSQRRTALLYDAPLSTPEDIALVKAMLLFFDDIAVFSTAALPKWHPPANPRLCAPLVDRGLLQFVAPLPETRSQTEVVVRSTLHRAVMENAEYWAAAASAGAWEPGLPELGPVRGTDLVKATEASAPGDLGSSELFTLLAQEGWLFPDEWTGQEWYLMPGVASVANSILAQAVRAAASEQGWRIEPVATRRNEAKVFTAILEDAVQNVGAADVVMSDLSAVTLDLTRVGLDDMLDFRARHQREFRAHVLALQALMSPRSTGGDLAVRKAALVDEAQRLRELQVRRWPDIGAGVSLGLIGAAWTLASGDLLGALIGAAGSQLLPVGPLPASAYAYVLRPDTEAD